MPSCSSLFSVTAGVSFVILCVTRLIWAAVVCAIEPGRCCLFIAVPTAAADGKARRQARGPCVACTINCLQALWMVHDGGVGMNAGNPCSWRLQCLHCPCCERRRGRSVAVFKFGVAWVLLLLFWNLMLAILFCCSWPRRSLVSLFLVSRINLSLCNVWELLQAELVWLTCVLSCFSSR